MHSKYFRMDKAFYAKVKFLDDNDVRVVPTKKIVEYQIKNPSNIEDFDKKKIYTCMWSDDKNPEEIELPIQISHLAGNKFNKFCILHSLLYIYMYLMFQ